MLLEQTERTNCCIALNISSSPKGVSFWRVRLFFGWDKSLRATLEYVLPFTSNFIFLRDSTMLVLGQIWPSFDNNIWSSRLNCIREKKILYLWTTSNTKFIVLTEIKFLWLSSKYLYVFLDVHLEIYNHFVKALDLIPCQHQSRKKFYLVLLI